MHELFLITFRRQRKNLVGKSKLCMVSFKMASTDVYFFVFWVIYNKHTEEKSNLY